MENLLLTLHIFWCNPHTMKFSLKHTDLTFESFHCVIDCRHFTQK